MKGEDKKHKIALSRELALDEVRNLSQDRILNEWINE